MSPYVNRFVKNYSPIHNLMQDTIEKKKREWYSFSKVTQASDFGRG